MKRVLVIGNAGAGKTTFAKRLSQETGLPLVSLDHLFWKPNWEQRGQEEFDRLLQAELDKAEWIIDGNYARTLQHRIQYADTVLFLDYNRWICTWRVIKRYLFTKEDQAEGCKQKIDWQFFKYVFWDYSKNNRLQTVTIKHGNSKSVEWIIFRSPKELSRSAKNSE